MMRSLKCLGVILALAMLLVTFPAGAKDKPTVIEAYQANAMLEGAGVGSMATIKIYRWSSDAEREEILSAIKKATGDQRQGNRLIAQALRGQEKTGYAFLSGRQGYPLRYARAFDMGNGKRQIILATDRPVSFSEVYDHSAAGDWDVSMVLLNVDENGKGDGILSIGTRLKWNESTGKLKMDNYTSQPTTLGNVRPAHK